MTARRSLDPDAWRRLAEAPTPALVALWADTGTILALFDDAGTPDLVSVPVEQGFYPALSPFRPEAAPFERMVRDLWGYHAAGGTDGTPLLDFGHWPMATPLGRPTAPFAPEAATTGRSHRGILWLLRGKSPRAAARFAARVDGAATVAHSLAFARAAETASGIAAPPRAEALRSAMAALERLAGATGGVLAIASAAGARLLEAEAARLRDHLAATASLAFGHRLMMDCVVPGGGARDLAAPGETALRRLAAEVAVAALPALAAPLADRLHDLPAAAACLDAALAALPIEAAATAEAIATLPEGPLQAAFPAATGEALGHADGPSGRVLHWLRLEGGQIAGAFLLDPAWSLLPARRAALAAAPGEAALLAAASPGTQAGLEL